MIPQNGYNNDNDEKQKGWYDINDDYDSNDNATVDNDNKKDVDYNGDDTKAMNIMMITIMMTKILKMLMIMMTMMWMVIIIITMMIMKNKNKQRLNIIKMWWLCGKSLLWWFPYLTCLILIVPVVLMN